MTTFTRQSAKAGAWLVLLLVGSVASAQTNTAPTPSGASAQPDYHPSMGDLMTMSVQPRHIKLGLAGRQRNWAYASYELSELRNAFARIARTIPKYQSMDTADMVTALTKAPLDAIQQAILASDPSQFTSAYAQLTQACNACHKSQNHAPVVIKVPNGSMFPDQDFRPPSH